MSESAFAVKHDGIVDCLRSNVTIHNGIAVFSGVALWDTGASGSCISDRIVDELALIPIGEENVLTPSGKAVFPKYLVDVTLPNNVYIPDVQVLGSRIGDQGLDMLIGMDIITTGDLLVANANGRTVFSFRHPSRYLPNFVDGISASNIISDRKNSNRRPRSKKK